MMSRKKFSALKQRLTLGCAVIAGMPIVAGQIAYAQSMPATAGIETVVVTSSKRATNLQSTPIAIASYSGAALQRQGITSLKDLSSISPGLIVGANAGQEVPISIRGISSGDQGVGGDSPVAVYLNGVYIGQSYGAIFNFADIERIEIARGPQGTLYGRNSTAGAINVITTQPSADAKANILLRYGNYNAVDLNASASGPVGNSDKLFFALGGSLSRNDGWQKLASNGQHVNGLDSHTLDGALRYTPTSNLDITLNVDHSDSSIPAYLRIFTPGVGKYGIDKTPLSSKTIYASGNNLYTNIESDGGGLTINYDAGPFTVKSITGYRYFNSTALIDNDGTDEDLAGFTQNLTAHQVSQEVDVTSNNNGPFKWLLGLYYYNQHATNPFTVGKVGRGLVRGDPVLDDETAAVFANVSYDITSKLTIGAGLRYSYEKKDFVRPYYTATGASRSSLISLANGTVTIAGQTPWVLVPANSRNVSHNWYALTPKGEVDYHFTKNIYGYASVSTGQKSGGYSFSGTTTDAAGPVFGPEKITAYEAGLKTTLFNHQLRFNIDGYYYDYSGLQVAVATSGAIRTIFNAGSATVNGIEAEFEYVPSKVPGLNLSGNIAVMPEAKYDNFVEDLSGQRAGTAAALCLGGKLQTIGGKIQQCNLAGNRLPRAPKVQLQFAAEYTAPVAGLLGSLTPRVEVVHQSSVYYTEQDPPDGASGTFTDLNLKLTYTPNVGDWEFSVWCKNVTDEQHIDNSRGTNIRLLSGAAYSDQYGFTSAPLFFVFVFCNLLFFDGGLARPWSGVPTPFFRFVRMCRC